MATREYMEGQHFSSVLGEEVFDVTISMCGGTATTDSYALHTNSTTEVPALDSKANPIAADVMVIADTEDGNKIKSVTLGSLPVNAHTQNASTIEAGIFADAADYEFKGNLDVGGDLTVDGNAYVDGGGLTTSATGPTDLTVACGTEKTIVLQEPVWDDLRVSPNALPLEGALLPTKKVFANDGVGPTSGTSLELDGVDDYGLVPDYAALDSSTGRYSISFWMNPTSDNGTILYRDGYFSIRKSYDSLVVSMDNSWEIWANSVLTAGADHHIVVTVKDSKVKVYVNASRKKSTTVWGLAMGSSANDVYIGQDGTGSDYFEGRIDEIQIYDNDLDSGDVDALYNLGQGECTALASMVLQFSDSSTNGYGSGTSMSEYNGITWLGSPIVACAGGSAGSVGVVALAFPPDSTTSITFSVQLPHTYKEEEDINFHIHWATPQVDAGDVVWGLEYVWVNVHNGIGNTTIEERTITPLFHLTHLVDDIATLTGTGMKISSNLSCRLFRKGDDPLDTYPNDVFLNEADFHFQIDTAGSRQEWYK